MKSSACSSASSRGPGAARAGRRSFSLASSAGVIRVVSTRWRTARPPLPRSRCPLLGGRRRERLARANAEPPIAVPLECREHRIELAGELRDTLCGRRTAVLLCCELVGCVPDLDDRRSNLVGRALLLLRRFDRLV